MNPSGSAVVDALETIEQALWTDPDELPFRAEALRLRVSCSSVGTNGIGRGRFRQGYRARAKMGEKARELRATTSLARLLAKQGRRDEARTTLDDIYSWFTKGFGTADLKEAKTLLEKLRAWCSLNFDSLGFPASVKPRGFCCEP